MIRGMVSERFRTAAGSTQLTTEPFGATILTALKSPALAGTSGARADFSV